MKQLLATFALFACIGSAIASDNVVVPPGHKVVVISATANSHVSDISSGVLIVDYGKSGNWRITNAQIEAVLAKRSASAVVILQEQMIGALTRSSELNDFFAYWKASKKKAFSQFGFCPSELLGKYR